MPMPDPALSFETCRPLERDARLAMEWRNEPTTRRMFYHPERLVWDSFWPEFRDTYFGDPAPPVFARVGGERAAFLRFEPAEDPRGVADRVVEISIIVSLELRAKGLGTRILRAVPTHLSNQGIQCIYAEVKRTNPASIAIFRKAGFEELDPIDKLIEETGEVCPIARFVLDLPPHPSAL